MELDRILVAPLIEVYMAATTVKTKNGKYTTINELTDQSPALTSRVLHAAVEGLLRLGSLESSTVLLSEDDKGAILSGIIAYRTGLPLAMARKYPYKIPGSIVVDVKMEYNEFRTSINGIEDGDRILIVDDTLATGGTVAGLIEACTIAGAIVEEVWVVTEKLGYGGRERLEEYGVKVKSVLGIRVNDEGAISVETVYGLPL